MNVFGQALVPLELREEHDLALTSGELALREAHTSGVDHTVFEWPAHTREKKTLVTLVLRERDRRGAGLQLAPDALHPAGAAAARLAAVGQVQARAQRGSEDGLASVAGNLAFERLDANAGNRSAPTCAAGPRPRNGAGECRRWSTAALVRWTADRSRFCRRGGHTRDPE